VGRTDLFAARAVVFGKSLAPKEKSTAGGDNGFSQRSTRGPYAVTTNIALIQKKRNRFIAKKFL
jgi:hypothetical protein